MVDIIIFIYLGFAMVSWNKPDEANKVCIKVDINIEDENENGFLKTAEVKHLLESHSLYPLSKKVKDINTRGIENLLLHTAFVKTAQCYITNEGYVNITLTQRTPVMRVKADVSEFVANQLHRMDLFYRYGLQVAGWNKYSYISLEYPNQVICTRRDLSKHAKPIPVVVQTPQPTDQPSNSSAEDEKKENADKKPAAESNKTEEKADKKSAVKSENKPSSKSEKSSSKTEKSSSKSDKKSSKSEKSSSKSKKSVEKKQEKKDKSKKMSDAKSEKSSTKKSKH